MYRCECDACTALPYLAKGERTQYAYYKHFDTEQTPTSLKQTAPLDWRDKLIHPDDKEWLQTVENRLRLGGWQPVLTLDIKPRKRHFRLPKMSAAVIMEIILVVLWIVSLITFAVTSDVTPLMVASFGTVCYMISILILYKDY